MRMPFSRRRHPQHAAIVHVLQQVRRRARRAAPVVGDRAVREVVVHLAGMHVAALADEVEHELARVPWRVGVHPERSTRGCISAWTLPRDEPVVDEEVLLDAQRVIAPLEIAGPVAFDAMPERQILCPRRRADRVGLYKAEALDGVFQTGRWKQGAGDGEAAEVGEGHGVILNY